MSARTPLAWYGGKQMLARQIVPLFPAHRDYLEPFAGGAAVLFAKPRAERETLNDLDGQLMRFWRVLRERPDELAEAVALTPYARMEWRASRDGDSENDVEAARRLLVNVYQSHALARHSFSAVRDGGPWKPRWWATLPPRIVAAAKRLTEVQLESCDALRLIEGFDRPDTLIYCDPPYGGAHRLDAYDTVYAHDEPDLWARLIPALQAVEHACVVLSGYPCAGSVALEDVGWQRVPLVAKRIVQSRDGETLPDAPEHVWLSPNVPAPLPALFEATA